MWEYARRFAPDTSWDFGTKVSNGASGDLRTGKQNRKRKSKRNMVKKSRRQNR